MIKNALLLSLALASSSLLTTTSLQAETPDRVPDIDAVNWGEMLARHDLIWNQLPKRWDEAPFLGNGEQGTMMYQLNPRTLRWDVGCSAAHDHRPMAKDDLTEKNVTVLNRGRHFIGHLEIRLPANLSGGSSRLDLWNAEATGTLEAKAGKVEWSTIAHANEPVMRFELKGSGSLKDTKFSYVPHAATNPRAQRAKTPRTPANPAAVVSELPDGVHTSVHNLHAGGQTAVAWKQIQSGGSTRLWLSVKHSFPSKEASSMAVAAVRKAAKADQAEWLAAHRTWWHDFYPASFVSTGDPYWDSFYWVQQYKIASATRDKGWIMDNQGPWLQPTAWNALWWNLNVQVAHSNGTTANRREMVSALSHRLDILRDNLALNVAPEYRADSYSIGRNTSNWDLLGYSGEPGKGRPKFDASIGRECGNLIWAMHNVDMEYRYWQDKELRDKVLYPILLKAVNYYRHFLTEGADGLLHLPKTYSPEYRIAEDCSYDIDLLRWGNNRLLELAAEQGLTEKDEPLIKEWKTIQAKLTPTHVNETGFMIGKNVALTGGHRHWSHLLSIYPLRTITPENDKDRELILRSLNHWHSFKKGGAGYSVTGGSCMASLLGDGDRALEFLNRLKRFLRANTFYSEIGLPVIETPIHGATAMQEMLLQSWGERLRIFPAVPKQWPDVQFHQLRGEGAYLVSARRENDRTSWALIQSEAGGTVEVDAQIANAQWTSSKGVKVTKSGNGIYQITTEPGNWVLFWPKGTAQPKVKVTAIPLRGKPHRFGQP
ncbi:hypothetical protein JIN77_16035 [Verrucomicrobiaceae bacterium R5-34]|nr:hypothetical protein [Verrucomicrobiaceae bacterium R5-34]